MDSSDPENVRVPPGPALGLPRGLALNAARLVCPGRHLVTKFTRPAGSERRAVKAELEQELDQNVFVGQSFAYVSGELDHPKGNTVEVSCDIEDGRLHLFDLRAAIVARAKQAGLDAWFVFGGEIHVAGFPWEGRVGHVLVQPRLHLRVASEGFDEPDTFVVARARSRSLLAGSLAELDDLASLVGEAAERLAGVGPRRGRIVDFDEEERAVILHGHVEDSSWPLTDYTVAVNPALLTRRFGAGAFVDLQIASGSLTRGRKKNLYVVKDRFLAAAEMLGAIGTTFPMPAGDALLEAAWAEVRLQEGA